VLSVVSFLPLTAAIAAVSPDWLATLVRPANRLPPWVLFVPAAPLQIALGGAPAWAAALRSALFAAIAGATSVAIGGRILRDGLTRESGPNRGRHRRAERLDPSGGSPILGAVARKELYLLFRDRTLFTQAIVLPFVIVGTQFLMNHRLVSAVTSNPRHAAAMAFGTAAFVLSTGACNTLVMDAPTLWIYFGVPRPLDRLVREKAVFWSFLAGTIALVVFVALTATRPGAFVRGSPALLLALVGVALNAFIATGIGVLGTNPLETELRRRIQPSMIYLYMQRWRSSFCRVCSCFGSARSIVPRGRACSSRSLEPVLSRGWPRSSFSGGTVFRTCSRRSGYAGLGAASSAASCTASAGVSPAGWWREAISWP
jgi:hypothetical protein